MKHLPLIAIVLVGLALRLGGIGHGLSTGDVGHPDTPKQIAAIRLFMEGERYVHNGLSDYDGYPFFASYLTSLGLNAFGFFAGPILQLVGEPADAWVPEKLTLFWVMRLMNVLLATLAIVVAWRIGKEHFGNGAGLVAGLFLALSPADVAACHYASGDTAAAVFGLVSVFFSLRIYRRGAWADYVLAGFFAALAFASKYHALVICGTAGLAHLLRSENIGRWHKPGSLVRLVVLGLSVLGGLFFAIPGLREHPVLMVKDILHFMEYAANFALPPELKAASFSTKLTFSLGRNLPILCGLFSIPVVIALGFALLRVHRDARVVLLLAAPLLYFLMGVSMRPYAHPVYHTIMTAPVFLLAAVALQRMFAVCGRARIPSRCAAVLLTVCGTGLLAHGGFGEVFFFRRDDTRVFSRAWAAENIPASYAYYPTRYTFLSDLHSGTETKNDGLFIFSPSIRPAKLTEGFLPWFSFGVESDALPFFRNPEMSVRLGANSNIRTDGAMPVFQRQPSVATTDYIFVGIPEFYRSGRILDVPARGIRSRVIVSKDALRDVLVCASADAADVRLEISLGGITKVLRLKAHESGSVMVESPRRRMPFGTGYCYYDLTVSAQHGGVRMSVAFSDRERGVDLFQQGSVKEALPWLDRALKQQKNPTLNRMRFIASGGQQLADANDVDPSSSAPGADPLFATCGISTKFLDDLPYLHWDPSEMRHRGFRQTELPALLNDRNTEISLGIADRGALSVSGLWLEPGSYTATLRVRTSATNALSSPVSFVFHDGRDGYTNTANINLSAEGSFTNVTAPFHLPRMFRSGRVEIRLPERTALVVDSFEIRPDPGATVRSYPAIENPPAK